MVKFNRKCINQDCHKKFLVCKNKRKRCGNHRCAVFGCNGIVKGSSSSDRCVKHLNTILCKHEGCNKIPPKGHGYCYCHECENKGCSNVKMTNTCPGKNIHPKFCEKCTCMAKNCFDKKHKSDFCCAHGCPDKDCKNDNNCKEHVCKANSCHRIKSDNGEYCTSCTCKTEGCRDGKIGPVCCTKHMCKAEGCFSQKTGKYYCDEHQCIVGGCEEESCGKGIGCTKHKCRRYDCEKLREPNSEWCVDHTCCIDGCAEFREKNEEVCRQHSCSIKERYDGKWIRCGNKPINMEEEDNPKKWVCKEHMCSVEDCRKRRTFYATDPRSFSSNADLSQYCKDHACELCIKMYSSMSGINIVIEGSKCCKKHTCAEKIVLRKSRINTLLGLVDAHITAIGYILIVKNT